MRIRPRPHTDTDTGHRHRDTDRHTHGDMGARALQDARRSSTRASRLRPVELHEDASVRATCARTHRALSAASRTCGEPGKACSALRRKSSAPNSASCSLAGSPPLPRYAMRRHTFTCKPSTRWSSAACIANSRALVSAICSGGRPRTSRASRAVSCREAEPACPHMHWRISQSLFSSSAAFRFSFEQLRFRRARQPASCTTGSSGTARMPPRTAAMPPACATLLLGPASQDRYARAMHPCSRTGAASTWSRIACRTNSMPLAAWTAHLPSLWTANSLRAQHAVSCTFALSG
mmetsp:Transcript_67922/g.210008  ORF Transcript_67922/g.210008 Transcript_67922/m.210008 type:complete len:292 (+) Transcript_67922:248-1123(+)